jgi:SAM-dependent methyltransferase
MNLRVGSLERVMPHPAMAQRITLVSIARTLRNSYKNWTSGKKHLRNEERRKYPFVYSEELVTWEYSLSQDQNRDTLSIDLGCGANPRNPFFAETLLGLDVQEGVSDTIRICDIINNGIDKESCKADFITAFDFVEHVPRISISDGPTRFPFIELMNEVNRVLKPGGLFYHRTPAYPNKAAFQDPTHVNIITEDTFPLYFCGTETQQPWARMYGFTGNFELLRQAWIGSSLIAVMKCVKQSPGE